MTDYSELLICMDKLVERGDKFLSFEIASLRELIDEVAVLREDLEHARRQPLYSTRRAAARYQHIKSTWHDGGLIDRLAANVLPEDWDAAIDADMGKGN